MAALDRVPANLLPALNRRTKSLALLALVCCVVAVLYLFSPHDSGLYAVCPFKALTGLHCPGCGTLRGLHELTHGHPVAAFGLNPLMVLSLPFIAFSIIKYIVAGIIGWPEPKIFIPSPFIWSLLAVIVLFWVLRNLPFYPFTLLAP
jgi:hypothetical protein